MRKTASCMTLVALAVVLTVPAVAGAQEKKAPAAHAAPARAAPARAPAVHAPAQVQRAARPAPHVTARPAPRVVAHPAPHVRAAPRVTRHPTSAPTFSKRGPVHVDTPSERARKNAEIRRAHRERQHTRQNREQRRNAHQEREQRHLGAQKKIEPNAAQSNATDRTRAQRRARLQARRNAGVTPQAARQGRFAARYRAARAERRADRRFAAISARRAWHRGLRASFVAWYGPVFWPYAYSDIFDYTFWPSGYDDGYWAYAYDDFLDGVFWGPAGPPEAYAYADAAPREAAPRPSQAGVVELCKEPGTGVTAWPFEDIEKAVAPTPDQEALLVNLRSAAKKAADVFKASCPSENAYPATPPGRLRAMMARLLATLDAVKIVRPTLEKFYESLSDEQKAKFNDIGPKRPSNETTAARASGDKASNGQAPADNNACRQPKPGLSNLPIERIEKIVKPTDQQEDALSNLEEATNKAGSTLQAACPDEIPLTPVGRMEAMESRLQAMLEAAKTVEHPLDEFYSSLSDEQKARFNKLGRQLARSN